MCKNTLCIIPARGGSKRIERKNIKEFAGKPIIAYSIEAALKSGCFSKVMVSTDDEEIADVARRYGAEVPFMRSAETANDFATTADVLFEVLDKYAESGIEFDAICCLYATAPFVTSDRLREGHALLNEGNCSAAFTCVEYSYPIQRSLAINADGHIGMKYPEYAKSRSQDLDKSYHDAGQFYFTTVKALRECGSLWGPDTLPIILPELEVQDLDTLQDWALAELKYEYLHGQAQADAGGAVGNDADINVKFDTLPFEIELDNYRLKSYHLLDAGTSELMREERNREDVRMWSVNQDEISQSEHNAFVESLGSRDDLRYYSVFNSYDELVGSVNLKRTAPGHLDRGIWILQDRQGLGYASSILQSLYGWLAEHTDTKVIETIVKPDNKASMALECRLGAKERSRDNDMVHYELNL